MSNDLEFSVPSFCLGGLTGLLLATVILAVSRMDFASNDISVSLVVNP